MNYKIKIIKKENLKTDKWSGGTTTQLAIYPENSIYSKRDFMWRISSAKVEVEESNFTSLPGINRIIMIIEGELLLEHKDHHKKILRPFQQDTFKGDWETKSYGEVTDYNLMTSGDCSEQVEGLILDSFEEKNIENYKKSNELSNITIAVYNVEGDIAIVINDKKEVKTTTGDIAIITARSTEIPNITIKNENYKKSKIINSYIRHD